MDSPTVRCSVSILQSKMDTRTTSVTDDNHTIKKCQIILHLKK